MCYIQGMSPNSVLKKYLVVLVLFAVFLSASFILTKRFHLVKQSGQMDQNKVQVTTSFYPLYFFAQQVGGSLAQVTNITPAGSEPHDYEPSPQQIAQVQTSKMLVLNGGGLEAWADKVIHNLEGKPVLIVTAGENFQNGDPHVWLSPVLAKQEVQKILQGYQQVDPSNQNQYIQNAQTLSDQLGILDQEFRQGLQNCSQRNFVTSHTAFGYLAKQYNLNQVAISGLSPEEEPSPSELANVAAFAKENYVNTIFFESLVSPKLSETIAKEAGAKTAVLNPLEGLSDEELQSGKDYFSVMRENLSALRTALACQ